MDDRNCADGRNHTGACKYTAWSDCNAFFACNDASYPCHHCNTVSRMGIRSDLRTRLWNFKSDYEFKWRNIFCSFFCKSAGFRNAEGTLSVGSLWDFGSCRTFL